MICGELWVCAAVIFCVVFLVILCHVRCIVWISSMLVFSNLLLCLVILYYHLLFTLEMSNLDPCPTANFTADNQGGQILSDIFLLAQARKNFLWWIITYYGIYSLDVQMTENILVFYCFIISDSEKKNSSLEYTKRIKLLNCQPADNSLC